MFTQECWTFFSVCSLPIKEWYKFRAMKKQTNTVILKSLWKDSYLQRDQLSVRYKNRWFSVLQKKNCRHGKFWEKEDTDRQSCYGRCTIIPVLFEFKTLLRLIVKYGWWFFKWLWNSKFESTLKWLNGTKVNKFVQKNEKRCKEGENPRNSS